MHVSELVLVLDFGSQYTQLIARRIRELSVYSEIHPFDFPVETIRELKPKALILSGGPQSVYGENAPLPSREIFELGIPILGICYGMQLTAYFLGGKVEAAPEREYGRAQITAGVSALFKDTAESQTVWMSQEERPVSGNAGATASLGEPRRQDPRRASRVRGHREVA
jgi:GMP synthase (glutamine-hydrolysing)